MSGLLVNKTAIVTGGSRGIGFSIAKLFAEQGANVQIWGINGEAGQAAAQTLSEQTGRQVSLLLLMSARMIWFPHKFRTFFRSITLSML